MIDLIVLFGAWDRKPLNPVKTQRTTQHTLAGPGEDRHRAAMGAARCAGVVGRDLTTLSHLAGLDRPGQGLEGGAVVLDLGPMGTGGLRLMRFVPYARR